MTATPPRADLRTLAAEAKENTCDHPVYVHKIRGGEPLAIPLCQLCGAIGWDDLREQVAEHRRMVLAEAAEAIEAEESPRPPGAHRAVWVNAKISHTALLRRLAAAAPPAGLSAPVPAETAPAVPEEADGQRAGEGVELDALKALDKAATPGPWFYDSYCRVFSQPRISPYDQWSDPLLDAGHTLERYGRCDACGDAWPLPEGRSPGLGPGCAHAAEEYRRDPLVAAVPASAGDSAHGDHQGDAELIAAMRNALPQLLRLAAQVAQYWRVVERVRALTIAEDGHPVHPTKRVAVADITAAVDALPDAGTDQTEGDHGE